jgi:hypothetical protein
LVEFPARRRSRNPLGCIRCRGAYWLIDRRLHLRDAVERREEHAQQDARNREAALEALHVELESNAATFKFALNALRKGTIGYPLFDITTLKLAFEPAIFVTLQTSTVKALLQAFNRMGTVNDLHAFVFDRQQGPTAVTTAMIHAAGNESERSAAAASNWVAHRGLMSQALLQRCENDAPYLYEAIDAVERELHITPSVRAADRDYVAHEPIGYIESNVTLVPPP